MLNNNANTINANEINIAELITSFNNAKEKLFIKLTGEDKYVDCPRKEIANMVETVHIRLNQYVSIPVTNTIFNSFDIDVENLFRIAEDNTRLNNRVNIQTLPGIMSALSGMEVEEDGCNAVVVTNENMRYGATALFYSGVLDGLYKVFNGDYYILPSSVHEVICVPATVNMKVKKLIDMVTEINSSVVDEDDKLTDSVYTYDGKRFYQVA